MFLLPVFVMLFLLPPFLSGIMAHSFGRSFWKWFIIGCFLPFIANFIQAFLPDKTSSSNVKNENK